MATSVFGNSGFTQIVANAKQENALNAATASVANITLGSATSGSLLLTDPNTSTTVYGYAPSTFATAAAASTFYFLKTPGQAAATALTDTNLLTIPASATIERMIVQNNGTTVVGLTTITIGTTLSTAAVNSTPTTLITDLMLLATVNAAGGGGAVGGHTATIEVAFGTAGQAATIGTLAGLAVPATTATNYVAALVNGGPNTAGDLVVKITYTNV